MKKISMSEKASGEIAMRDLCHKAWDIYSNTDPLTVAKCEDGTFSMRGLYDLDDLTFEQVEKLLFELGGLENE